jgi:hypothetical protein
MRRGPKGAPHPDGSGRRGAITAACAAQVSHWALEQAAAFWMQLKSAASNSSRKRAE